MDTNDIKHVLSYRWAGAYGQPLHSSNDAPIDFLRISSSERVWVDYLNHMNHDDLKLSVIENMGNLYASKPVYAKYLHDFSTAVDREGLSKMLSCITRGWIWQEIAFTGPDVVPEHAEDVRLIVELIKTGPEIVRGIIHNGYFEPKNKDVNEVIKFAIDVLWRARNLADNESAYVFFIQEKDANRAIINEAIDQVIRYRESNGVHPIEMKLLAAMDNLENVNFTKVEDAFVASFSTLLQANEKEFDPIPKGKLAPANFREKVTDVLRKVTKKQSWDIEWWQQSVQDHPLSTLNHPAIDSIVIEQNNTIGVKVGGKLAFHLKMGYNRPLQGQELDKSEVVIDGEHDILSLSYRVKNGEVYIVGFQTTSLLRIVPDGSLLVGEDGISSSHDIKSRWMSTTWYSRDSDWLQVLQGWKKNEDLGVKAKKRSWKFWSNKTVTAIS